jgi:hypothetical protein
MDAGLIIALVALSIGVIAVLKVPRQMFLKQPDSDVDSRLEALEQEVVQLREDLGSAEERLDFAERALTRVDESRRLPRDG